MHLINDSSQGLRHRALVAISLAVASGVTTAFVFGAFGPLPVSPSQWGVVIGSALLFAAIGVKKPVPYIG